MTTQETLDKIKNSLTGDNEKDLKYLEMQANRFISEKSENAGEILDGITEMMFDVMPEEKKNYLKNLMYIGNKRLDAVYSEAEKLVREKKIEESIKLTQQLYDKVTAAYRETESSKYMCFRNPLEHQLYLFIYAAGKKLERSPFDLCKFLLLHAYNLVELRKPAEAAEVLNRAIRYNPVNPEPYFELAECYKVLCEPTKLLKTTKETLMISTTPYALSRCYANLGFYCVEKKDYDSAVCFYYESLLYADHPGIQGELMHIASITQKKIQPPVRKEVVEAFKKYDLEPGADKDVLSVTAALAKEAMKGEDYELARFYLLTLYGLTRDPDVKTILERSYGGIPESLQKAGQLGK